MPRPKMMDSDEIFPRKLRPRKIGDNRVVDHPKEYYRDVEIPALRAQLSTLRYKLKKASEQKKQAIRKEKDTKNEIIYKQKLALWKKKHAEFVANQNDMNKRSREYFEDKVKYHTLKNRNYIDGITAYPIIQQIAREQFSYNYKKLTMLILISHFDNFLLRDAEFFGYSYTVTSRLCKKLIADGLVEVFKGGRRNSYALSIAGRERFKEIQKFYKIRVKKLLEGYEKNRQRTKGWTGVKINLVDDDE